MSANKRSARTGRPVSGRLRRDRRGRCAPPVLSGPHNLEARSDLLKRSQIQEVAFGAVLEHGPVHSGRATAADQALELVAAISARVTCEESLN